jgi:hypothetical protein
MARPRPDPLFSASPRPATEASPEEPAYFALLPTAGRSLRLSFVSILAVLALACEDSTAPDRPLTRLEAGPERQDQAGLVDQTHWADGYVWADDPTAASYTPDPFYSFNRTGGAIQITKPAGTTGSYLVKFAGLSAFLDNKSTLHVTGHGGFDSYCKPVSPYLVNDAVEVRCFRASTGAAVNEPFTVLVLRKASRLAFAHAHRPSGTNYSPRARGSWNSEGTIRVVRLGVGGYRVIFNGLGLLASSTNNRGHVQVSAVGTENQYCKVESWTGTPNLAVDVRCFTRAGAPGDTKFNVLFLLPSDHLAYAFAQKPVADSYFPDPNISSNPVGGDISIARLGTGLYEVSWAGIESEIFEGGNPQVTATGTASTAQCKVSEWGAASVLVRCFAPNGALIDTQYNVLFGS